jgi:hypothetical protein
LALVVAVDEFEMRNRLRVVNPDTLVRVGLVSTVLRIDEKFAGVE